MIRRKSTKSRRPYHPIFSTNLAALPIIIAAMTARAARSWRIPTAVVKLSLEESSMPLPPIQVVMEEVTDPQEIAEAQAQMEQARRNSAWLQAHAHEIYTQHRGKFIVVAGEELFVGNTPEEANALAKAAHPEDKGRLSQHIYPQKMTRRLLFTATLPPLPIPPRST